VRGEWDPYGKGIRPAPSDVAKNIWNKAKKLHIVQLILTLSAVALFYKSPV